MFLRIIIIKWLIFMDKNVRIYIIINVVINLIFEGVDKILVMCNIM